MPAVERNDSISIAQSNRDVWQSLAQRNWPDSNGRASSTRRHNAIFSGRQLVAVWKRQALAAAEQVNLKQMNARLDEPCPGHQITIALDAPTFVPGRQQL